MTMEQLSLDRARRILEHPVFVREYERLQRLEQGRIYCGHALSHFLDVARVCWIGALEQGIPVRKDLCYALGLLHDIGKGQQYQSGTPHHLASARLAEEILADCGFDAAEIRRLCSAIRLHRRPAEAEDPLVGLLYAADKKTRLCFCCEAGESCNWPEEKKNKTLI